MGKGRDEEPSEKCGEESDDEAPPAWLQKAAQRHEQRQQRYASMFDGARSAVEQEKTRLGGLFDEMKAAHGDEPDEEPAPDLFGDAAKQYQERQKSLGSIFGDAVKAKEQEKEALKNLFGKPSGKPRKK